MKVKILVSRQGPGINDEPGDIRDADESEAAHMIACGEAEPYKASRKKKAADSEAETSN